jgi:hypothetical protein
MDILEMRALLRGRWRALGYLQLQVCASGP